MSKLVYITGASSGIGQALAKQYLLQGDRVIMIARRQQEMQQWCEQEGFARKNYIIYKADVRDVDSITAVGRQCIDEMGVPDVVIAAAGVSIGVDTEIFSDIEVMRKLYETNVIGVMATFHPFITPMKARGTGQLVGIASVGGIRGLAGHGAYCSSKAAVISYCESLRLEMHHATGAKGVSVLTVLPGFVATPLTQHNPYEMPFMLTAQEFARSAVRVIDQNKSYAVIPWQMGLVAKGLRVMPNFLFDRLFSGRKRKPRDQERP